MSRTPFLSSVKITLPLIVVAAGASTAFAGMSIAPVVNIPSGPQPSGVTAADFNGDGFMDLATTTEAPDKISVFFGNGSGGYAAGPTSLLPNSSSPQDLEAGDLDGDGDADLAVAVRDPVGSVLIMSNSGAGAFAMSASVAVQDRPRGMAIADMDNDGDLDIAVANRDSNSASVLTNNGGSFTAANLAVGGETRTTAFGDIDGDGDLDLAVSNHDGRSVHLFTNTGGVFAASATLFVSPLVRPEGVIFSDLDNDGDADLAVGTSDGTLGINQAAIFLNAGGAYGAPTAYATGGTNTSQIVAADLDCDGLMDLATTNQDSNNVSILGNLGGAVFGAATVHAVGIRPGEITAADLDGDGDSDLAVEARDSNALSILINDTCQPKTPCPGDANGDGLINVSDLVAVISDWGTNGSANGGNVDDTGASMGIVDVADLIMVITNWGACP